MKLSLFHTFVFLPAWFRPDSTEQPSDSPELNTVGPPTGPRTSGTVWNPDGPVRFPLYVGPGGTGRGRGQRGEHRW